MEYIDKTNTKIVEMKLRIIVRKIEEGLYIGSCPNLEGCHIEAPSAQEARTLVRQAINQLIHSYKQHYEKIPTRE